MTTSAMMLGVKGDRCLDQEAALHIGPPPPACTRATAATCTDAAPAAFSTRAQASAVAPVVITSSTKSTRRPASLGHARFGATKAAVTLRRRPDPERPPWLGVLRRRTSAPGR